MKLVRAAFCFSVFLAFSVLLTHGSALAAEDGYYARNGCFISSAPVLPKIEKLDSSFVKTKFLDIKYENIADGQKMDMYLPDPGAKPYPVIIAVHGGGFKFGNKEGGDVQPMLDGVRHGYAVAVINYRLSGEAKFPAAIQDLKAAIRFVRANAARYGIDPAKIALWGDSAGGNLVALAGTTGNDEIFNNPYLGNPGVSTAVHAVVDWFGPIDFLTMDRQFVKEGIKGQDHNSPDSFESQYLGRQITKAPELVRESDPAVYITDACPPFLIEHGTADVLIPCTQSIEFAKALRKKIGSAKVQLVLLKCAGHGGPAFQTEENMAVVWEFLDKWLRH